MRDLILPREVKKSVKHEVAMVIGSATSEEGPWMPVMPEDLPAYIKRHDVVRELSKGMACCNLDGDGLWYVALHIEQVH